MCLGRNGTDWKIDAYIKLVNGWEMDAYLELMNALQQTQPLLGDEVSKIWECGNNEEFTTKSSDGGQAKKNADKYSLCYDLKLIYFVMI